MLMFRVVVVGGDRLAPSFTIRLARPPRPGQMLDLPRRGGLVIMIGTLIPEIEDFDGIIIARPHPEA